MHERSLLVDFVTYFTVIQTKTYIFHISTLPKSIRDKNDGEKALISLRTRFLVLRNNFSPYISF